MSTQKRAKATDLRQRRSHSGCHGENDGDAGPSTGFVEKVMGRRRPVHYVQRVVCYIELLDLSSVQIWLWSVEGTCNCLEVFSYRSAFHLGLACDREIGATDRVRIVEDTHFEARPLLPHIKR